MFKKTVGLIFALCLVLAAAAIPAAAESAGSLPAELCRDESGAWEYGLLEDGTAVITGFTVAGDALIFPEAVDGVPVSMIARTPDAKPDYASLRTIQKVTLPKGLKAIGDNAFDSFAGLKSIKLPDGLESIGEGAFRECQSLREIKIPKGVRVIRNAAFSGCRELAKLEMPAELEAIEANAFFNCRSLKSITFPAGLKTIGDKAFSDTNIASIKLNEGLETIGERAFFGHKMTKVSIPSTVQRIGNAAFAPNGNKPLTSLTISSARVELGRGAFGYDDGSTAFLRANKKKQEAGETVSNEYDRENPDNWSDFYADYNNNKNGFGQGTLDLSCYAGSTADKLYQYHVKKTYLKRAEKTIVTAPAEKVLRAGQYSNDDLIDEIVIPEGVEEIEEGALSGLHTVGKVTLPSTMVKIGARAFDDCIYLQEVSLPDSVTEIGEAAFRGCTQMVRANIPAGLTEISDSLFENCGMLKKLTLPKETVIRRIGKNAFAGCEALADLKLNKGLEEIGELAFSSSGIKNFQVPDTVTTIGRRAFYKSGLTNLRLPAEMEEIPERLCEFSSKLTEVVLPKNLKRIGKRAFAHCGLRSIKLPEGLVSIGEEAFAFDDEVVKTYYQHKKRASYLTAVTIPASVETLERRAFAGCDAMSSLTFAKGSQLKEIPDETFTQCFSLKKAELPDTVTVIGTAAFRDCKALRPAKLGKSLTSLGDEAFKGCQAMAQILVPDTLTQIGQNVLQNHGSKLKVICGEGSAMWEYMKTNFPKVQLAAPKP